HGLLLRWRLTCRPSRSTPEQQQGSKTGRSGRLREHEVSRKQERASHRHHRIIEKRPHYFARDDGGKCGSIASWTDSVIGQAPTATFFFRSRASQPGFPIDRSNQDRKRRFGQTPRMRLSVPKATHLDRGDGLHIRLPVSPAPSSRRRATCPRLRSSPVVRKR